MQNDVKSRLRAPNFSREESILLCEILKSYKHILENKKTDGVALHQKHKAWVEVTNTYNSNTTGYIRTLESLQQNYKNLKKKTKKKTSDKIMNIPVDKATLLDMVGEHGTSPDGWKNISASTGISTDACQEAFADMVNVADAQEREERRSIMRTGGGPSQKSDNDPLMDTVRGLVGPAIEAKYSIYDGDRSLIAAQEGIVPIEANLNLDKAQGNKVPENPNSESTTQQGIQGNKILETPNPESDYFLNERTNLKRSPHPLLARKRKLPSEGKEPVAEKFRVLASEKMELVSAQRELLRVQLIEEEEKLEHNRLLRQMEVEDAKKRYEHNELIRKLQIEKYLK